jgi:Na+-transporting NADH:ubiquinone oxidoreductase subunit NqrF
MQIKKVWFECAGNDGKHYMVPAGAKELEALQDLNDNAATKGGACEECRKKVKKLRQPKRKGKS